MHALYGALAGANAYDHHGGAASMARAWRCVYADSGGRTARRRLGRRRRLAASLFHDASGQPVGLCRAGVELFLGMIDADYFDILAVEEIETEALAVVGGRPRSRALYRPSTRLRSATISLRGACSRAGRKGLDKRRLKRRFWTFPASVGVADHVAPARNRLSLPLTFDDCTIWLCASRLALFC